MGKYFDYSYNKVMNEGYLSSTAAAAMFFFGCPACITRAILQIRNIVVMMIDFSLPGLVPDAYAINHFCCSRW